MSEHDLQTAIIQLIRLRGGIATRVNSGSAIYKDGAGRMNVIRGAERGTSDILACYRGRYLAIEVKYGHGKPSPAQVDFGSQVMDAGGKFLVSYDLDEVFSLLDKIDLEDSSKKPR